MKDLFVSFDKELIPIKSVSEDLREPFPVTDILGNNWPRSFLVDEDGIPIKNKTRGDEVDDTRRNR